MVIVLLLINCLTFSFLTLLNFAINFICLFFYDKTCHISRKMQHSWQLYEIIYQ